MKIIIIKSSTLMHLCKNVTTAKFGKQFAQYATRDTGKGEAKMVQRRETLLHHNFETTFIFAL